MNSPRARRYILTAGVPLLIAALLAWSVTGAGLPELRQDWFFPRDARGFAEILAWYASGWSPLGFGSLQAYPTFYPLVPLLWLFTLPRSPEFFMTAVVFGTAFFLARSAMALGTATRMPAAGRAALALFAACNPWVYTEYVAGHPYMVLGYALLLALTAEIVRPRPRPGMLCILAAASIVQIEFFVVAAIPFLLWLVRTRRYTVLAVWLFFFAPVAVGILANYASIRGMPYGFDWERWESIPLQAGMLLGGYGLSYSAVFSALWPVMLGIVLLSVPGVFLARRQPAERTMLAIGFASVLYAQGASGFFAPVYYAIVVHIPESGLFRELYDLIAVYAVGVLLALRRTFSAVPRTAYAGMVLGALLVVPWPASPVSGFFVREAALPRPALPALPDARIVLEPAFQPLSLRHHGSGTDPDAIALAGFSAPLNEWFPAFPVDAALGYYERDADSSRIAALGAVAVIRRPYLQSDFRTLALQGVHPAIPAPVSAGIADPEPLLSLRPAFPAPVRIGDHPGENAEFFGDADPAAITPLIPTQITHDAREMWVDARPSFAGSPQNGSAFGGVLTSSTQPLALSRDAILARADGRIVDEAGRTVVPPSHTLAWHPFPGGSRVVRCIGTCVVALAGDPPPNLPDHHFADGGRRALAIRRFAAFPWLATAAIPAEAGGTLRYNVRYDRYWQAWCAGRPQPHLRLDTAINAWRIERMPYPRTLVLVHGIAALQTLLEMLAFTALAIALFRTLRTPRL